MERQHSEQPILALDLALSTGWACRDRGGEWTSGVQLLRFRRWLFEIIGLLAYEQEPRLVVAFEKPIERARSRAGQGGQALPLNTSQWVRDPQQLQGTPGAVASRSWASSSQSSSVSSRAA